MRQRMTGEGKSRWLAGEDGEISLAKTWRRRKGQSRDDLGTKGEAGSKIWDRKGVGCLGTEKSWMWPGQSEPREKDEAGDNGRALRTTQSCVATVRSRDIVLKTYGSQWRSECQKWQTLPSHLSLFMEDTWWRSLTRSLCSCLHPTVFLLVFHFGRPGTHLIF